MVKEDKKSKAVEGELENSEKDYDSLRSAKEHLNAAVDDVKKFVDEDFPGLARGAVDKVDETVTSSLAKAADVMIKALEDLKARIKKKDE